MEIGTEGDVLLRGHTQSVIKEINGARRADGGKNAGDRGAHRFQQHIAQAAANLPWRSVRPDGGFINSAIQKAIEILKGAESFIHWRRYGNGVVDVQRHTLTLHLGGLCADPERKTRMNVRLLEVEKLTFDVESAAIATQRASGRNDAMAGNNNGDRIPVI